MKHQKKESQKEAPPYKIKSTKYDLVTFLPRMLLQQLKNVIVIFYIFNAILNLIPSIAISEPGLTVYPLLLILFIDTGKEVFLEVKRLIEDKRVNEATCYCVKSVNSSEDLLVAEKQIQDLKVGDIITVKDNDYVPADCVLLKAGKANGQVLIMTDALDGESDLKSKYVLPRCQQSLG